MHYACGQESKRNALKQTASFKQKNKTQFVVQLRNAEGNSWPQKEEGYTHQIMHIQQVQKKIDYGVCANEGCHQIQRDQIHIHSKQQDPLLAKN